MVWNVIYYSINEQKIKWRNIFDHGGFLKDCMEAAEFYDKEGFETSVRFSLRYYFGYKSEWEVLIVPWLDAHDQKIYRKIDVAQQVEANWEQFIDYTWKNIKKEVGDFGADF